MAVTRRAALRGIAVAASGAAIGAGVYSYTDERHRLQVTRTPLPMSGLPPRLADLRIGFLCDVHHGPFVTQEDIAAAVTRLMADRPDLILLGGDYVNWQDRRAIDACAEALASLRAPQGVFAVLGNHDDERATVAAFKRQAIRVLADERTAVFVRGELLELIGLRYWTRRVSDIREVLGQPAGPAVLVAHDPRRLLEAAALGIPAVVSGHTHGGQIVLPLVGAIAARKFPIVAGPGRLENTSIFVSRGVGTIVLPYRLNCPPEVAVLTLARQGGP